MADTASTAPVTRIELPGLRRIASGKVRELYELGDRLLLVASDRLSAFDVVFGQGIPGKGTALTKLSTFWFNFLGKQGIRHHFISDDVDRIVADAKAVGADLSGHTDVLRGRSMLVEKLTIVPAECIVRGYVAGSGWKEYQKQGTICGIKLPAGLQLCSQLEQPLFTPSTKAEQGQHDENISFDQLVGIVGANTAAELRDASLKVYSACSAHARSCGVIIADTKFEFGRDAAGQLVLADEVMTPDSSRFWPADDYAAGRDQASFDKQIVRNWAEGSGWNKKAPAPELPAEIIDRTAARYAEVIERLTR
ncbi:MAG: phosphoribosylaminoimidazolesuccinocarboxamide synthase [Planctomycetota bacterium]